MMYVGRMLKALQGVVDDPKVPLAAVYWNVVPRDKRRFPLLVWQRASGATLAGLRYAVERPVIRLALIGDYRDGCGDFEATETTRQAVVRALQCAKVLADWPDEPSDSFDESLERPRVDWLISLRGE